MKKRIWYADILRIVAIAMVVLIHVASKDFHRYDIASFNWQFLNFINGVSRISVPLFFMVSGIFFLDPNKKISIRKLYTKNIWRLIRVFLFWSVVYLVFDRLLSTETLMEGELKQTAWEIIQGNFHLWFLYRMAEVYVMVPLLRAVVKDKKLMVYFLLVSLIVGFLVPTVQQFPIRSTFILPKNGVNLDITIGYVGYMVAGYALHRYTLPKVWRKRLYAAGIIGTMVTVIGTSFVSLMQGEMYPYFYEYLTPNVLVGSMALFVYMKQRFQHQEFSAGQQKWITTLSAYSFGVYLVHVLVRNILWKAGINTTFLTPVLSVPILALVVGGLSMGVTFLLKRTPFLKKIMI